jgi:hypothetical protein
MKKLLILLFLSFFFWLGAKSIVLAADYPNCEQFSISPLIIRDGIDKQITFIARAPDTNQQYSFVVYFGARKTWTKSPPLSPNPNTYLVTWTANEGVDSRWIFHEDAIGTEITREVRLENSQNNQDICTLGTYTIDSSTQKYSCDSIYVQPTETTWPVAGKPFIVIVEGLRRNGQIVANETGLDIDFDHHLDVGLDPTPPPDGKYATREITYRENQPGMHTLTLETHVWGINQNCAAQVQFFTYDNPDVPYDPQAIAASMQATMPQLQNKGSDRECMPTAIGCIPTRPGPFVNYVLTRAISIGAGLAFLLLLFGAFTLITSAGNPENIKKGQETITSAIIGLLFIIFSVFLLRLIGVDILKLPGFTSTEETRPTVTQQGGH